jgi:DNA gyrase subunit B
VQHDGVQRAGNDLRDVIERARVYRHWLEPMARKAGSLEVVEQAAIAGALTPKLLNEPENAQEAARYVATRLDLLAH